MYKLVLSKIETEKLDGVILAQAGLKRLGLDDQITQVFKADEMIPAVGQGHLLSSVVLTIRKCLKC